MKKAAFCSSASFFLLSTPFVVFLKHYHYPYLTVEIALSFTVLAAISLALGAIGRRSTVLTVFILSGLITLLLDVQFTAIDGGRRLVAAFAFTVVPLWLIRHHAARIVTLAAGAMLLTTVAVPRVAAAPVTRTVLSAPDPSLPFVLHVILDEHAGGAALREGALTELRDDVNSFYADRQFLLFDNAYSEYFESVRSLAHLFNFSLQHRVPDAELYGRTSASSAAPDDDVPRWTLTTNRYLERLVKSGFRVHVYQSKYIDLCAGLAGPSCESYRYSGVAVLADLPIPARDKAFIIASILMSRSRSYIEVHELYDRVQRATSNRLGLPEWGSAPVRVSALVSSVMVEKIREEVRNSGRGDYFLAHLLMPHHPFMFSDECKIEPVANWVDRVGVWGVRGVVNTPQTRALRYARYASQVRCTYRKLAELLDAIPENVRKDAIVILHGDHGSRLTIVDPVISDQRAPSDDDLIDSYSTLFAVRSPQIGAGRDHRQLPIACLLAALSDAGYLSIANIDSCPVAPEVYLSRGAGPGKVSPRRLPLFKLPED